MLLKLLIDFVVLVVFQLILILGIKLVNRIFKSKKSKSIEKPTYTIIQNITTINNFNNTQELPK